MRVKIIEKDNMFDLEYAVNEFLNSVRPSSIIDIKYSGRGNHSTYSLDYYSVMIIMNS
jgi:hypothetical protein